MVSLDVDETLIVLGISALSNPAAKMALENLKLLRELRGPSHSYTNTRR